VHEHVKELRLTAIEQASASEPWTHFPPAGRRWPRSPSHHGFRLGCAPMRFSWAVKPRRTAQSCKAPALRTAWRAVGSSRNSNATARCCTSCCAIRRLAVHLRPVCSLQVISW